MKNSEKACDEFLQTIHSDAYYSGLSESEQKLWNTAWQAAIEFSAKVCEKKKSIFKEPDFKIVQDDMALKCANEIRKQGLS